MAGGYDTQNLGDYASFLGLYKTIRSRDPGAKFTVLSRHPEDQFGSQFNVNVLLNLDHSSKAASLGRVFNGLNEGDDNEHIVRILRQLSQADALVLGNGRLFVDIALGFMRGPLNYFALLVVLARFLNKPVILSSVTLVHPETDSGKDLLGLILGNADLVVVREQSSADVAYQYIANRSKVIVLPDIAFALSPADADMVNVPKEFEGAIGVNFRGVNYTKSIDMESENSIKRRIMRLIDRTDLDVVFCHQCTYDIDEPTTDDRYINKMIYESLPKPYQARCHMFYEKWTLAQVLGQYAVLQYLFTERRHGFIMSLTQGTIASLICREKNTLAMSETIPIRELFLEVSDELIPAKSNPSDLNNLVLGQRELCNEYSSVFSRFLG